MKHLGNSVIWLVSDNSCWSLMDDHTSKHCNRIDVMKISITFAFKACPKVCNQYLRSFVKADHLAIEVGFVPETREAFHD